jgi:hypothetical protein
MSNDNQRIGGAMDSDHIYYNINVSNDYPTVNSSLVQLDTASTIVPLTFTQYRAQPYLYNPSEYFLAVQRFTIESPNLPVFIPQPVLGSSNVNDTIYTITIINGNTTITRTVQWQPQSPSPQPSTPITQQNLSNPYYYCYSYQWFIKCINDTLHSTGVANHPIMSYNPETHLFSVQGKADKYRTSSTGALIGAVGVTKAKFYMNAALYNLFASLPSIYAGIAGGLDYQILFPTGTDLAYAVTPQPYIINVITISGVNYINVQQEYNTLPLFTPIKSIVFRGSLINVVSDMVATPVIYQNGVNINAGKQNTDILPVLIEYSVPLTIGTEYKPYIYYEPTAEYRLMDLYSDTPVYGLNFDVFWKDSFGNLVPFTLGLGASATMKILFRKKSFSSDKI